MSKSNYPAPRTIVTTVYYLIPLFVVGTAFYFMPALYHLVGMLFMAFLFSYLLRPPVEFLQKKGLTRNRSTIVVFVLLFLLIIGILGGFSPLIWRQAVNLQHTLGELQIEETIEDGSGQLEETLGFMGYLNELEKSLGFIPEGTFQEQISRAYDWGLQQITGLLFNLYLIAQYMVVIPFIAFFLVRDQQEIEKFFLSAVPNVFFEMAYNIYIKVDGKIGEYMRGLALEALFIAILSAVGLYLLSVPYAVTIGIFVGLANIVPYIGPVVGAVPALIVQFVETESLAAVLAVVIVIAIVQFLDNLFVKPVAFSHSMSLHPLIVILVIIAGGQLAGVLGMILGIPVAASLWVIGREFSWAVNHYRFK